MKNIFKKLTFINNLYFFLVIAIVMASSIFISINSAYDEFDLYSKDLKLREYNIQKIVLKQRVDTIKKLVEQYIRGFKGDDIKNLKKNLLSQLREIRWGDDGYIFVYNKKGICIMLPVKPSLEGKNLINLTDPNGVHQVRELIDASSCDKSNHFVEYSWYQPSTKKSGRKIAYGVYIKKLGWMLGSSVYKKNIDHMLKEKKRIMQKTLDKKLYLAGILFLVLFILSLILMYLQSKALNGGLRRFHTFLKKAHEELEPIDVSKLYYSEIQELAISINYLIRNIKKNNSKLSRKNNMLKEAIDNFKSIFDFAFEGIIISDIHGNIVDANLSMRTLLGLENIDDIRRFKLTDFICDEYKGFVEKNVLQNNTEPYKIRLKKSNQKTFKALVNGKYIYEDGRKLRISTVLDLTPFEKMKKAQEKSKAKSIFLSNMSHEIRTPLNAIMGFIDILKEKEKDKKKLEYLNIINNSSSHLISIINDILDFSKIESKKIQISKVYFDPRKELETIVKIFEAQVVEKKLKLFLDIEEPFPKAIYSDKLRINQIITNLVGNAIKFTPKDKHIYLEAKYKDEALMICVKDEGIGIAKDKREHIFEAFTQEDETTTRKYGGTGLGLSISYELVKLLKGELSVASEVGNGSQFCFYIPAKAGTTTDIRDISTSLDNNTATIKGKAVLLVEDNKANQMYMKITLKKIGISTDIANDGLEAVDKYKKNHDRYDFILMDENMPNLNGIEATKKIRIFEKEENLPRIFIVALTANAIKGDRERFLEADMDEYISKPVKKETLINTLNNLLSSATQNQKGNKS